MRIPSVKLQTKPCGGGGLWLILAEKGREGADSGGERESSISNYSNITTIAAKPQKYTFKVVSFSLQDQVPETALNFTGHIPVICREKVRERRGGEGWFRWAAGLNHHTTHTRHHLINFYD